MMKLISFRHSATAALFEKKDVIIVASVSCSYGLGDPIDYNNMVISLRPGNDKRQGRRLCKTYAKLNMKRNDIDFSRNRVSRKREMFFKIYFASRRI